VAQLSEPQPRGELAVMAEAPFTIEQQRQPFGMRKPVGLGVGGELTICLGHTGQSHRVQPVESGMLKHRRSFQAQSAPSCDFGQVGERFGNVAFGIDDGNHRRGQFAPS